ncbi:related to 6-hydroxy-d-nicotine oxidase [Cephalotrichum gorgonifer]|uniref:Related to 6-hydroxy-d-nicotine oxidase n=1 Tax=Cephalotrichum gorgonifer TaxID=2041049 RepID=A0AAE8N2N4_9PEZI|nr:related to 6-hydroxy-d-nicotine oxidase [Cephalotrichum gorgonifer]
MLPNLSLTLLAGVLITPSLANIQVAAACVGLALVLPGKVFFPNTTPYNEHNSYWSARQDELTPNCFVAPHSASDVSKALKVLRDTKAPFTVKSGGHVPFPSSNVDTGVVIDLSEINGLTLSADKTVVSVGPGNRWTAVAEYLLPEGLAVVGGRVGDIGVSGLTLGGGISWFSGRYGWACDNVREYEVVLANGSIVVANVGTNPDLYKALRGGGGPNFGIVTRFDLETFEQGNIWYKESLHAPTEANEAIEVFSDLAVDGLNDDDLAHPVMFAAYQPALGGNVIQIFRWHATPPADLNTVPAVFEPLEAIPAISEKNASLTVPDMLNVYVDAAGLRKGWWDTSIRAGNAAALQDIIANYGVWAAANLADKPDVVAVLLIIPIPTSTIAQFGKNGGNSLGVDPNTPAQIKINTYITWGSASQDSYMNDIATQLVGQTEQIAKDANAFDDGFIYMNYAERTQDVYGRRGPDIIAELKATAKKFDPKDVLKNQWKGYFKV